jgi:hypothetical protein
MTGEWEAKLKRMQRGEGDLPTFMAGIEAYVRAVVDRVTTGDIPWQTAPRRLERRGIERTFPAGPQRACRTPEPATQLLRPTPREDPAPHSSEHVARAPPNPRHVSAPPRSPGEALARPAGSARAPSTAPGTCAPCSGKIASASPTSAPTRRPSAAPRPRAATCCSSCRPAPASPSVISSPASRAAAPRSSSARSSPSWRIRPRSSRPRGSAPSASTRAADRADSRKACIDYLAGGSTSCSSRPSASACRASRRCWRSGHPRSSPSTRPTASRSGATTSARITACSASDSPSLRPGADRRPHRDRHPSRPGRHRRPARPPRRRVRFIHGFRRTTSPSRSWS